MLELIILIILTCLLAISLFLTITIVIEVAAFVALVIAGKKQGYYSYTKVFIVSITWSIFYFLSHLQLWEI